MVSPCLNIISLNIEQDRHFDRIIPFFKKQKPDVILLQEVLREDLPYLEKMTGMQSVFTILNFLCRDKETAELGLGILSAVPIVRSESAYYKGDGANIPYIKPGEPEGMARAILTIEVMKDKVTYCLINTHFTWSPNGKPNVQQYQDVEMLLQLLTKVPEFILCGDFNAPRGTAIFDKIALQYKDNIPSHISTTIDKKLHKAGDLNLVVDGIFTTPHYQVRTVDIMDDLSDHCAISAMISKI